MPDEIVVDDNTPVPQLRDAYNRATQRADTNAEAASRVPHLERENALLRAGGDPDSRVGRLLLRDDDLDWSNRDAVKAAWTEVVPPAAETPPAAPAAPASPEAVDEAALARQERSERLNSGATSPGQEPTPDPWDEANAMYQEGRRKHQTQERAAAPALDHVIDRAVAGDPRVIHDPRRPYSEQYNPR
jgi:hypothetical protein